MTATYRVIDLPYCPESQTISDGPLVALLSGQRVISTSEHFYTADGRPHLLVVVQFRSQSGHPETRESDRTRKRTAPDPAESLTAEQRERFERLRAWRMTHAQAKSVPPYVVLTNEQVAEISRREPQNLQELAAIPGIGRKRLEEFGTDLLSLVRGRPVGPPVPNGQTPTAGERTPS